MPSFAAVARATADFASRSANIGKTKRRIMKTTLLLTALLCWSAQASDITVDIFSFDYNRTLIGSFTMPQSSRYSPELSLGGPNKDWHPFGLTGFFAELHGSFTVATPGTGFFDLDCPVNMSSGAFFNIAGVASMDKGSSRSITISTPGTYNWSILYSPEIAQDYDHGSQPTGRSWIELTDFDHVWGPSIGVPESTAWWLWLVPAGILLLVLRTSEKQKGEL